MERIRGRQQNESREDNPTKSGDRVSGHLTKSEEWEDLARKARFKSAGLAALCRVSPRQLQRFFAERDGSSPRQWMRDLQFELAAKLIREGSPNKSVIEALNFESKTHFCREFKRRFGLTPRDYFMKTSHLDKNVASGSLKDIDQRTGSR